VKTSLLPELSIALLALGAASGGAYALGGTAGVAIAAVAFAAVALAVAGWVLPASAARPTVPGLSDEGRRPTTWFHNFWRLEARLTNGTKSLASYEADLGPQLQHLLAARLAEHHGINLYAEPDAARRLFCARPRDAELWAWVAPRRPQGDNEAEGPTGPATIARRDNEAPGIAPGALARLVRKLENL
jgi:hypothetical protein